MNLEQLGRTLASARVYWSYFLAIILFAVSIGCAIYGSAKTTQTLPNCDPSRETCKIKTRKYAYIILAVLLILLAFYILWYNHWRYLIANSGSSGAKREVIADSVELSSSILFRKPFF
jgi:H+/Cl- antiporter ClcA